MNTEIITNTNAITNEETVIATPNYDADYYTEKCYDLFGILGVCGAYSRKGIKTNVEVWERHKNNLINLLRKHPNWNEEAKAVVIDLEERRPSNGAAFRRGFNNLLNETSKYRYDGERFYPDICKKLNETISFSYNGWDFLYTLRDFANIPNVTEQFIRAMKADYSDFIDQFHIHVGQKMTRVLNKIFNYFGLEEIERYNSIFAAICDSISETVHKRKAILSANFLDYMTMSNGNSWSSCHGVMPYAAYSGCYKAGCLSYSNDYVTMIFYTIDGNYDGTEYYKQKKITRQVFFYDGEGGLIQERLYPTDNEASVYLIELYSKTVKSIIAKCENCTDEWEIGNAEVSDGEWNFAYPDWDNYDNWTYILSEKYYGSDYVTVNAGDKAYCLECGEEKIWEDECDYEEEHKSLYCAYCDGRVSHDVCCNCGRDYDLHWSEAEDDYICENCGFYCEYHERWEHNNDRYGYVEDYGDICDGAFNYGNFYRCEHCDHIYHDYEGSWTVDNETWCQDCVEDDAEYCDGCQIYHESRYTVTYETTSGYRYCQDYAEEHDMLATCNVCGCIDLIENLTEIDGEHYCEDCEPDETALVTCGCKKEEE